MPKAAVKEGRPRKARLFAEKKVSRVLAHWKIDLADFIKRYDSEPSLRPGREKSDPTREEIKAVHDFTKTGDFDRLKKALGKSSSACNAAVARVLAFQARK
jgi:hypothetical protein